MFALIGQESFHGSLKKQCTLPDGALIYPLQFCGADWSTVNTTAIRKGYTCPYPQICAVLTTLTFDLRI
jgi:hypothetical protein